MIKIFKFEEFNEDVSSCGVDGMGSVVSSQPGEYPGTFGTSGSGDVGFLLNGKRKKRKRKMGGPSEVSDARFLKPVKLNRLKY